MQQLQKGLAVDLYNDYHYLTCGVKHERRHELVLAMHFYEEQEALLQKKYHTSNVLLVINRPQ